MSRRMNAKVPKYAFVRFCCDRKTLQIKTKDLVWDGNLTVNMTVKTTWEDSLYEAEILALSDDPTILNEKERCYMDSLSNDSSVPRPSNKRPVQRRGIIPVRKTSLLRNRSTALKRKMTKGIEYVSPKQFRPASTTRHVNQPRAYELSTLSPENMQWVMEEPDQPTTSSEPTIPPPAGSSQPTLQQTFTERPAYVTDICSGIEDILAYVKRLEEKVDQLSTQIQPVPNTKRDTGTQTDTLPEKDSLSGEQQITPPQPLLQLQERLVHFTTSTQEDTAPQLTGPVLPPTDAPEHVETPDPIEDLTPRFTDRRFLNVRPAELNSEQINHEFLQQFVERQRPDPTETVDVQPEEIISLLTKSAGSAKNFAKNLVFRSFTIGELYGRNATGKNFVVPGGIKKKALNPVKLRQVLDLVALHYKQTDVEKQAIKGINSGLCYLWNIRFGFSWLDIAGMIDN